MKQSHYLQIVSKAKINVYEFFFKWSGRKPKRSCGVKKEFQKTLILAFDVIMYKHLGIYCTILLILGHGDSLHLPLRIIVLEETRQFITITKRLAIAHSAL